MGRFTILSMIVMTCAQFLFVTNYGLENNDYAKCAPSIKCDANAKYRSFDGTCNNLKTPWLGASKTPHLRLDDAYYSDGKYEFRTQMDGDPLPNAREINLKVFVNKQSYDWNEHNVLFMQWGQFVAHDITLLPADTSRGSNCCEIKNTRRQVPAQCKKVIEVPENDPIYAYHGQRCINFNRAETSSTYGCPLKPATFMVLSNHFIDGSQIYGTDKTLAASLRSFQDGLLKSEFYDEQQEFCPQKNQTAWDCETSPRMVTATLCFDAGDRRSNQNLGIALFHNMFLRFHNFIADKLYLLNPSWNDETLYQEARRIVVAIIQIITYNEYLPILLGRQYLTKNEFFKPTVYDEDENPSTSIEFSAGAFRVLHKQIPTEYSFIDEHGFDMHRAILTDWMNRPNLLIHHNNYERLLRGFQDTNTRADQPSYNPLISSFLFMKLWPKFNAHDLLAVDIQRGRDAGIPPYNRMRSLCGIPEAETFDDLTDLMHKMDVEDLKQVYSSVDDIDFIVGALLEKPVKGTKVGPTTRCIIADSFRRYKNGDRLFYDVVGQPSSFTTAQLETLKKINFGHVICATSTYIKYLPRNVFVPMKDQPKSQIHSCETFEINLSAWKDN